MDATPDTPRVTRNKRAVKTPAPAPAPAPAADTKPKARGRPKKAIAEDAIAPIEEKKPVRAKKAVQRMPVVEEQIGPPRPVLPEKRPRLVLSSDDSDGSYNPDGKKTRRPARRRVPEMINRASEVTIFETVESDDEETAVEEDGGGKMPPSYRVEHVPARRFKAPATLCVRGLEPFSLKTRLGSPGFETIQLASKKAFWWAHIVWITVCFAVLLMLWTLGLSLYWGNRFASVGPPAPCDMTTSVRPFPQTYAESFKIFRRPDVSWDPVVRQQMEAFGEYIGADPWLMENCILPHNVMKLPLVTCQERLPWYNLTKSQVLWLNENNDWGYNLDWELTERFNEVFDMHFELQELQTSWMLSDHGPASPDYGQERCQACKDGKIGKTKGLKSTSHWPKKYWLLDPRQQALFEKLTDSKAFHLLSKVLGTKSHPKVDLINKAETDEPYHGLPVRVGPDMTLTDKDTSTWQPATSEYREIRSGWWR